jgi:hypothetical protein
MEDFMILTLPSVSERVSASVVAPTMQPETTSSSHLSHGQLEMPYTLIALVAIVSIT